MLALVSYCYRAFHCIFHNVSFFTVTCITDIYSLSLHDALPISARGRDRPGRQVHTSAGAPGTETVPAGIHYRRSEEHTSELQSRGQLVCRLLLEKKNEHEIPQCVDGTNAEYGI